MYLEEVLPKLRKGATISRKEYSDDPQSKIFIKNGNIICYADLSLLDSDDLQARDWIIISEPQ